MKLEQGKMKASLGLNYTKIIGWHNNTYRPVICHPLLLLVSLKWYGYHFYHIYGCESGILIGD